MWDCTMLKYYIWLASGTLQHWKCWLCVSRVWMEEKSDCLLFFWCLPNHHLSPKGKGGDREREQEQENGSGQHSRVQNWQVPDANAPVMFTKSPRVQAQHSRQVSSVTLLSSCGFHHVGKPASPLEWQQWLILVRWVSVFSEGLRFHSPFLTPYWTRIYPSTVCQSCPLWSGRVGSISVLLSYSVVPHPQYVVDCTDESLTIVMLTSVLLLLSVPLSAKSAKFLEQLYSEVPLEWKMVATVSVLSGRKTSWPLLYI